MKSRQRADFHAFGKDGGLHQRLGMRYMCSIADPITLLLFQAGSRYSKVSVWLNIALPATADNSETFCSRWHLATDTNQQSGGEGVTYNTDISAVWTLTSYEASPRDHSCGNTLGLCITIRP
jgi:hypothetical protein